MQHPSTFQVKNERIQQSTGWMIEVHFNPLDDLLTNMGPPWNNYLI
jgi:hypothetical protein